MIFVVRRIKSCLRIQGTGISCEFVLEFFHVAATCHQQGDRLWGIVGDTLRDLESISCSGARKQRPCQVQAGIFS